MWRLPGSVISCALLVGACASADDPKGPPPAPTTKALSVGGARLRGGGVRMDVQLGRGLPARGGTAGTTRVAPSGVVTP